MNLSVVICTHNPRQEHLNRTLEALKAQSLPKEHWELIIVDNCSDVPLSTVLDIHWHPHFRVVQEDELGILPARVRGLKEAQADLMLFLDDDNLAASDYLEQALAIGTEHPFLGVWGGTIAPEFEVPPPDWIEEFQHLLACVEVDEDRWSNLRFSYATVPPTAGMCLRRIVAIAFIETVKKDPRRKLLGRRGKHQLTNGEDTDLALTACDIGMGMGQFKRMQLKHLIPAGRLTEEYLLPLAEGTAYCSHLLNALRGKPPSPPARALRLGRFLWSSRRRRHFEGQLRALERACAEVAKWR